MAIKRIGFIDNFAGGGYGIAPSRTPLPRVGQGSPMMGRAGGDTVGRTSFSLPDIPTVKLPTLPSTTPPAETQQKTPQQQTQQGQPTQDAEIVSDPALLTARKLAESQRANAGASAVRRKRELAIGTGSDVLAREFGLDESTARAAKENPLSALAQLRDQAYRSERDFNQEASEANLFFGGYRGRQLGELAKAVLTEEARAQADARQRFSEIERELLAATGDADQLELDAELAAYERALERGSAGVQVVDPLAGDPSAGNPPPGPADFANPLLGAGFTADPASRRRRGLLEELLF